MTGKLKNISFTSLEEISAHLKNEADNLLIQQSAYISTMGVIMQKVAELIDNNSNIHEPADYWQFKFIESQAELAALRLSIMASKENEEKAGPPKQMTNPVIDKQGTQRWFNADGKQHRDNDLPAEIWANGTKFWWRDGKQHRDGDLPSVIWTSGTKLWYRDGKQHRDGDLPAETYASGAKFWYRDGKQHRDNDLPAVIWTNGRQEWWRDGKFIKQEQSK